ncbi:MAG: flagellar hook-associated protein 3 FlgL [Chlamydiales bacterium]|jgi:flagellar hook-associated protein 3 FlgL
MVGRVANNQLVRKILYNIRTQLTNQEDIFEQISSNKRILRPSSDPFGVSKSLSSRDQLQRNGEYEDIINVGEIWTNITAAALDNSVETWKRVNEIALSAADGTKTQADRVAMSEELEQLLEHFIQISNTTNGNRFIFGGTKTDNPPFRAEKNANTGRITGVFYEGDSFSRNVKTKDESSTTVSIIGSNGGDPSKKGAFVDTNTDTDSFKILIQLRDKLLNNDITGISGAGGVLSKIETAASNLTSSQVRLGGTQERLDLDRNRIIQENSDIQQFLSEIEDADVASLILELNNVQNVYEAALASGGRIIQQSLLNFI